MDKPNDAQQGQWKFIPLLLLFFTMLVLYYLNSESIDQHQHQLFLERTNHLDKHNASYSAELLTLNQQRKRSLNHLNYQAKELNDDLRLLNQLPPWLDTMQHFELQNDLNFLKGQIQHRVELGDRFARARSSYINSLIQLPHLKQRIKVMLLTIPAEHNEYRELFIEPLVQFIDSVEQFLLFPKRGGELLLNSLHQLQIEVGHYPPDPYLAKVGNTLVHLQIIVEYTAKAEQLLQRSIESQDLIDLKPIRQLYSEFYAEAQQARDEQLRWVELFAVMLLIGVMVMLERLRRAKLMLHFWNMNLQAQVDRRTEELEQARREAEQVIEYAADPLLILDVNRCIARFNHAAAELIGGDPASLLQRPIQELLRTSATKESVEEQWLMTASGHQVPVLVSSSKIEESGNRALKEVWSLRDITQVKQLYADIHSYQQVIDQMLLLTVADIEGNITHANPLFLESTGYSREEIIGQNHRILNSGFHPPTFWQQFWGTISNGEIWQGEICNQNRQGKKIWNNTSVSPMFNVEGERSGYLAIRIDITEQVELRQEREQRAYEGGIEEISASILHNIGNAVTGAEYQLLQLNKRFGMLNRVVVYLQQLATQTPLPEGESVRLEKLSQVLADFLHSGSTVLEQEASTFSHIEGIIAAQRQLVQGGVWMSRFGLSEAVYEVQQLMQSILGKYRTTLELNLEKAPVAVTLPKSPFQQALANLLKNCCESIGEMIQDKRIEEGVVSITIRQLKDGEQFEVIVEDNGGGIAEDQMEEIFCRGVTSKETGTGQGLHSIALFAQNLQGSVEAFSDGEGQGARFVLTLPTDGDGEAT